MLLAVLVTGELTASPRTPALFLALADANSARLLQAAFSAALRERTDLALIPPADAKKLAACEGRERFSCWVRAADQKAAYLFVISAQVDRASVMMIDLSASRGVIAEGGGEAAENRIFEEATSMSSGAVALDDQAALERWAIDLLEHELSRPLDRAAHWNVYGKISVQAPRPGLSISLDGAKLGPTSEGATKVADVHVGTHAIALDELGVSKSVAVAANSTAEVTFELPKDRSTVRAVSLWAGVGLAATGVVIETVALASAGGTTSLTVCRGVDCMPEAPNRFERAGPILVAPLGYALFGTGATWAGGALLGDEREDPWIAIIAGGAVGALAYGLSAALEGSR